MKPWFAALWLLALPCFAAELDPAVRAAIDASIRSMLGPNQAGLSVGVMHGDEVWFNAYGYADVEKKIRATPRTTYRMASVTKSWTAVSVLQLVEQGKLGLDDEIQKSVPKFPKKAFPVTVRQLLGHLGGVYHYRGLASERVSKPVTTVGALSLFQAWDLACEPGTRFLYTSYGYNLLGAAIEGASGKSYAEYLAANLFGPLEMKDSDIERPARMNAQWALGYSLKKGVFGPAAPLELSSRYAGGGTRSTVEDMVRFGRALLDGKLLTPESHQLMRTVQVTRDGLLTDYGLGFNVFPQRGHYVLAHAGGQSGTSTLLVLIPAERFVLALATNLEAQGGVLSEISVLMQEELLDSGVRWRHAAAADARDRLLHEGLVRILSYGLAEHSFLAADAPARDETNLPAAFARVDALLSLDALSAIGASDAIEQAHQPKNGEPFVRVGVAMASTIEKVFGKDRLSDARTEGPLPFFEDYLYACEQLECGWMFSDELRERIHTLSTAWEKSNARAVRALKLGPTTELKELQTLLRPAFADALIYPDLSLELSRVGLREALKGKAANGRAMLELGRELYPQSVPIQLSLADLDILKGDPAAARVTLKKVQQESAGEVTPAVLAQRADRLRRWGKTDAAAKLTKLSDEVFGRPPLVPPTVNE